MAMLEWAVPDDWDGIHLQPVKAANPASWITVEALQEQREAVADIAFRRYHCNQWLAGEHHWLAPGACAGGADPTARIHPHEKVFVGVDVGGERSASAVVWSTEDLRIDGSVFTGDA